MKLFICFLSLFSFTISESFAKEIDLKNIVLETDCPYLTPRPLEKGTRNEPLFVSHVAQKIADVKGTSIEEVAKVTSQNAKEILRLF